LKHRGTEAQRRGQGGKVTEGKGIEGKGIEEKERGDLRDFGTVLSAIRGMIAVPRKRPGDELTRLTG
jgi:hypothetical protein